MSLISEEGVCWQKEFKFVDTFAMRYAFVVFDIRDIDTWFEPRLISGLKKNSFDGNRQYRRAKIKVR